MQIIWSQGVRQLGINHARGALRRSGVGYHVKVPQLLVVGGTDQYFTKHGKDKYRYFQPLIQAARHYGRFLHESYRRAKLTPLLLKS
jgi:hypothetical protein